MLDFAPESPPAKKTNQPTSPLFDAAYTQLPKAGEQPVQQKGLEEKPEKPGQRTQQTVGDRLEAPSKQAQTETPAAAATPKTVYYDKDRGWYQRGADNQPVPFNPGKPVFNEASGKWEKTFDAAPPKPATPADNTRPVGPAPPIDNRRLPLPPAESTTVSPTGSDTRGRREVAPIVAPPVAPPTDAQKPVEAYRPAPQDKPIEIHSEKEFIDKVLNAKGPVVVDFGAQAWCHACRLMKPHFDDLTKSLSGKAATFSVDDKENSRWMTKYASSYPTMTVFDKGQQYGSVAGFDANHPHANEAALTNTVNERLAARAKELPPEVPTTGWKPADLPGTPVTTDRPLAPYQLSGFRTAQERDDFEKFAASKGFTPQQIQRAESMTEQEWACFNSMNEHRAERGIGQLQFSPRVKLISDYQADRQAAAMKMTHGNPGEAYNPQHPYHLDRLKRVGLGVDGMHDGENAAMGPRLGRAITNMWLNSPGHLRPINDGALKIGAVSCSTGANNLPYWTFDASTGRQLERQRQRQR